jgi:SAM-dependent methyltransferase
MDFMKKSKSEWVRFRNQKPEELLERIIKTSSNEGDIVADFFCGSGTTLAVAEKLGRKWVGCDLSKFAIHTTKKRLLDIPTCKSFLILNVGNYQKQKFVENIKNSKIESYINFILELYRAEPISGYCFLNGRKDWCFVHVGSVDSPITEKEVVDALEECKNANGKGLDLLGWDFEMGLDEIVEKLEKQFGIKIKLKQIPREVIESKETSKEIKFFDMNSFEVGATVSGKTVTLKLKDFVLANLEFVPEDVKEKIKNGMDYVDYWSVDFDFKNDVPNASWQSFRTNKNPNLDISCKHDYKQRGKYDILVRVADIFGNDATKLIKVEIK